MTSKPVEVKIEQLTTSGSEPFLGPESGLSGKEYAVCGDTIQSVITSISQDPAAIEALAENIVRNVMSIFEDKPRPEEDFIYYNVVMSRVPDEHKDSFAYFCLDLISPIAWHVASRSPKIQNLIDEGILKLEFS